MRNLPTLRIIPTHNILVIEFPHWVQLLDEKDKGSFRRVFAFPQKQRPELRFATDLDFDKEDREHICQAIDRTFCFLSDIQRAYIMRKPDLTLWELYCMIRWSEQKRRARLRLPTMHT